MKPGPQCGGGCCSCSALSGGGRELEVTATCRPEVGDRVVVEVTTGSAVLSAFLLFVLPLLGLVGGMLAGQAWQPFGLGKDAASLLFGFGALAIAFGFAAAVDRLVVRGRVPEPRIVEVLGKGAKEPQ
jgi:sigma-E factor negative regulatory protein RseC